MALPPWGANSTLACIYSPSVSSAVFKNGTRSPMIGFSMTLSRSLARIGFSFVRFVRYNFGLFRWACGLKGAYFLPHDEGLVGLRQDALRLYGRVLSRACQDGPRLLLCDEQERRLAPAAREAREPIPYRHEVLPHHLLLGHLRAPSFARIPLCVPSKPRGVGGGIDRRTAFALGLRAYSPKLVAGVCRSEEHTSELQSR